MDFFDNINECIDLLIQAINKYSSLNEIIEPKDFKYWTHKLNNCKDINDFLFVKSNNLNLLTISAYIGLSIKNNFDNSIFTHYKRLFSKVDLYLNTFPQLISNKKFKDKLKNLENYVFLSTLSELSLAYQLKEIGFTVEFETKFKNLKTGKIKDVDLSISKSNNKIHIEVYMPHKQLEVNGFFDPNQDDSHFATKIEQKQNDKFGQDGIIGLNGKILLAINAVFFESFDLKNELLCFNNENLYMNLINNIHNDIDGYLIFMDEFGHDNSFKFIKYIEKIKNP